MSLLDNMIDEARAKVERALLEYCATIGDDIEVVDGEPRGPVPDEEFFCLCKAYFYMRGA